VALPSAVSLFCPGASPPERQWSSVPPLFLTLSLTLGVCDPSVPSPPCQVSYLWLQILTNTVSQSWVSASLPRDHRAILLPSPSSWRLHVVQLQPYRVSSPAFPRCPPHVPLPWCLSSN
jgi:hypothetical protein